MTRFLYIYTRLFNYRFVAYTEFNTEYGVAIKDHSGQVFIVQLTFKTVVHLINYRASMSGIYDGAHTGIFKTKAAILRSL